MSTFKEIHQNQIPKRLGAPVKVFKSDEFLVQIFKEENTPTRLTINKIKRKGNNWVDGITWDQLMHCKRMVGYHDHCAIEVYPPDKDIVNVANMRHLWVVDMPDFAWKKEKVA